MTSTLTSSFLDISCKTCTNFDISTKRCPYYINGFAEPPSPCSAYAKRKKPDKRNDVIEIMNDLFYGDEDVVKAFKEIIGKEQTEKIIEKIRNPQLR